MNIEKVVFGFFVILSCTLNFGFFFGDALDPKLHPAGELFAAVVVNLITLVLKFGDRTHLGATHLATSLAACLQLIAAAGVWMWQMQGEGASMNGGALATVVSLSGGALVANVIAVILLIGDTLRQAR
jgi:hypothetical protein